MTDELEKIRISLKNLAVFRKLLKDDVLRNFDIYLNSNEDDRRIAYCEFVAALYNKGGDLGSYLLDEVLESENAVAKIRAKGEEPPNSMMHSMVNELDFFTSLSSLSPERIAYSSGVDASLPLFENTRRNFLAEYRLRLNEIQTKGYGMFAKYHMFTVSENGGLVPVKCPDPQTLESLTGYENERSKIIVNTLSLIDGYPANNVLLYGDAGTGKSSTVKALANEYKDRGLRLVEVKKNRLYQIPELMENLSENPLKFILFIDDLSFSKTGDEFTALKAILEGDVCAKPTNMAVYATSNRRNLVRETMDGRRMNDVHASDTIEETQSLSARFGLTVTFLKPDRDLYAGIVLNLAKEYDLDVKEEKDLVQLAEAHATRSGGRSPRAAKQFVEFRKALEQAMENEKLKNGNSNNGLKV